MDAGSALSLALKGYEIVEAMERGWDRLANGLLLDAAEASGFALMINADKSMQYQQNLARPEHRRRCARQCAVACAPALPRSCKRSS